MTRSTSRKPVADREKTAQRLLSSSAQNSYDPDVDLDWAAPLPDDKYFLPPQWTSLYGTELWQRMTPEQRRELGRQEITSMTSFGILGEVGLMHMLLKVVLQGDPTSRHAQYALTEVADECRHTTMFGRGIEMSGTRMFLPPRRLRRVLSNVISLFPVGVSAYAGALLLEELFDKMQRAAMLDEDMQPGIRMINRIHVLEEARHITFAREEIQRAMPTMSRPRLLAHRTVIGAAAWGFARVMIDPRVYKAVGLNPLEARRAALTNPHYQEFIRWMATGLVQFLDEMGLIGFPANWLWRRSFMLPDGQARSKTAAMP